MKLKLLTRVLQMKWVPFFFFVLFSSSISLAVVPTQAITAVRERTEAASAALTDADKAEISKFILSALNDIFLSKTSEEMAKTRRQILEQKGTKELSLYATAYLTIFRDQMKTSAYAAIQRIEDPAQQMMVRRNLMILVSELKSLLLVEFGLDRTEEPDAVIRYWAVKSLTNPSIVQQLNSQTTSDPEAAGKIFEKMQVVAQKEQLPEILVLVAGFGSAWKDNRSAELLGQLAARRIEEYKNCKVQNAWLDGQILNALAEKYLERKLPEEKTKTARSFALLLATVMQRWIQNEAKPAGQKDLSEDAAAQLITVMVETEDRILPRLEITAVGIRKTLERGGTLQPMYDELFGAPGRSPILTTRLKFDYGKDAEGRTLTTPPSLPPCPVSASPQTAR
jgi:hypothetical protein